MADDSVPPSQDDVEEGDSEPEQPDAPPPPPGFDSPPPPPPGFDSPPPPLPKPPQSFLDSAPEIDSDGNDDESEGLEITTTFDVPIFPDSDLPPPLPSDNEETQISEIGDATETTDEEVETSDEEGELDDFLSIDSLADSLSLLSGDWPSEDTETTQSDDLYPDFPKPETTQGDDPPPPFPEPETEPEDDQQSSEFAAAIDSFGLVSSSAEQQLSRPISARQSPFLRLASEVDSIPGDKLHATLSETEKTILNPDGTTRKQIIDGELILRNASKKHRAWDIEVHLESIDSTDFSEKTSTVKELDPTEETAVPYTGSGPRMLVLKEKVDTEPSRENEPSLSLVFSENPQDVEVSIEVENVSPVPLYDVEIRRTIPKSFILPEDRDFSIEGDSVVWDIGKMNIGEIRNLSLLLQVNTGSVDKINAGSASATYSAEATVSRARFDRVHSSGRQFSYVNAVEDDRPGVWHCTCVFENKSSFVVALSGATVRLIGREDPILDVSDIRQDVPPEGKWDSISKRVESDSQPSFTQEVRFSILPRVSVESTGLIELKEQQLTVLDAVLQKRYDRSRIKSYIQSKIEAAVTLENTGTSTINVVRILDDIPGIFETPSMEDVSIEIEGKELNEAQYRIDVVNGIQIEEKHVSPDSDGHGLRVTVGTSAPLGLQPGKTLVIKYPLLAPDPSPRNKLLVAPIRVDFSSERFGPVASRSVERPPMIRVVHKRRNISTGKEVFPGGAPGQYEILLMFHNNSDSALDDLALHDIVPGTFTIEGSVIRSDKEGERESSLTKESARDGTQVTWAVGRIMQDERIEVLYTIQGDPEAEYKVTDAQDFHGATFGEEVDEEPNIPEWLERQETEILPQLSEPISDELEGDYDNDSQTSTDSVEIGDEDANSDVGSIEDDEGPDEEISQPSNPCTACGADVGIGQSSCPVCGFTLSS